MSPNHSDEEKQSVSEGNSLCQDAFRCVQQPYIEIQQVAQTEPSEENTKPEVEQSEDNAKTEVEPPITLMIISKDGEIEPPTEPESTETQINSETEKVEEAQPNIEPFEPVQIIEENEPVVESKIGEDMCETGFEMALCEGTLLIFCINI